MAEFINTIDVLGDDVVIDSIIDRSITEFKDDQITTVGQSAFSCCAALTEVDLPNVTKIGPGAFGSCGALSKIAFPNVTDIGDDAFGSCTGLKEAKFPLAETIGMRAFAYNGTIEKLYLPSATHIKKDTFYYNNKFIALVLGNAESVCKLDSAYSFGGGAANNCYIYVPRALVEDYKVATNWSTYASQFRALEDYTVDGTITGDLDENKI